MNNIKQTAIRLIANAFLYEKEKENIVTGYRFDSSFLTSRGIVTINDLNALQEELNKLGWTFNILSFNDYVIQDKTFLAKMTRLGFSRVNNKTYQEIKHDYLVSLHNKAIKQIINYLTLYCMSEDNADNNFADSIYLAEDKITSPDLTDNIIIHTKLKIFILKCSTSNLSLDSTSTMTTTFNNEGMREIKCDFDLPINKSSLKINCSMLANEIKDNLKQETNARLKLYDSSKHAHKETIKNLITMICFKLKNDKDTSNFTCEASSDINYNEMPFCNGITINTPIKRFWLTCNTRYGTLLGKKTNMFKISFDNIKDINYEFEIPASSPTISNYCNKIIETIKNNIDQERSNKEIESCDIEKSDTFNPPTVKIGDTEWMAENLKYDDGGNGIYYNSDNGEYYYTWDAAKRVAKKLGWRLPSDEDWNKACEACGGIKNKQGDYENCSLKKELNIKLAGLYFSSSFQGIGSRCYFWSVLDNSSCGAWSRLFDTSASVTRLSGIKLRGYSVRLIK